MSSRITLAPVLALVLAPTTLGGCHMDQRYVAPEGAATWQLALTPTTPPLASGEETAFYVVETRIELPLREPTAEQFAALGTSDGRDFAPYPRRPWAERGDYEIEIELTLSNPTQGAQRVTVTLDGINEFHEYAPGVNLAGEDPVANFSGWERAYDVGPGQRLALVVREEEIDEIAVDLATVVNGAPNSNQVVYFENHSAHDPRSQRFIPAIVPALTGLKLGLRVEGNVEAMPPTSDDCSLAGARCIAIEAVVRVRDVRDRIVPEGQVGWAMPEPELFLPVTPEP